MTTTSAIKQATVLLFKSNFGAIFFYLPPFKMFNQEMTDVRIG